MQIQRQVIEQLLGMQPLRVPNSEALRPTLLQGLSFSRPGGYESSRDTALDYLNQNGDLVSLSGYRELRGRDPSGLWLAVSYGSAQDYSLGRDRTLYADELTAGVSLSFLPGFGGYGRYSGFLGLNNTNQTCVNLTSVPGWSMSGFRMSASGSGNADLAGTYFIFYALAFIPTPSGSMLVDHRIYYYTVGASSTLDAVSYTIPSGVPTYPGLYVQLYVKEAPYSDSSAASLAEITPLPWRLYGTYDPGDTITVDANGLAVLTDITPTLPTASLQGVYTTVAPMGTIAALHNGRMWTTAKGLDGANGVALGSNQYDWDTTNDRVLVFTELETINVVAPDNYLLLSDERSRTITALASTPSGLFVFGEEDLYIVSGDIATNNLRVDLFPDMIGCTPGIKPALVGGVVFCAWKGHVYRIEGAQATPISYGLFDDQDEILDLAYDPATATLAVMERSGVYHYDLNVGEWYRDEVSRHPGDLSNLYGEQEFTGDEAKLLPIDGSLHLFMQLPWESPRPYRIIGPAPGAPYLDPHIVEYRNLDGGNPFRRDTWRYVRVPLDTASGFTLTSTPYLYYRTHDESQSDIAVIDPNYAIEGVIEGGDLLFRFPWGTVSRRLDIRIEFRSDERVAIQPGVSIGFSPGSESSPGA